MIIGLDVGGTHTDVVLLGRQGVVAQVKVATDESDLFRSVLSGLQGVLAGTDPDAVSRIVLSTTLTTNAIVKHGAPPVAMLVTAGPGVDPEFYRTGEHYHVVAGAIDHRGRERRPIDESEVTELAERLAAQGIRHVGVVGKFSTRNPEHEVLIGRLFEPHMDKVFLGHRVSGHLNFPRRIATTFLNASVYPIHRRFFAAVDAALREKGLRAPVHIMKADGGTMSLHASIDAPCQTILSGPAASIMGAIPAAPANEDVVVLDIGGTTTDIALLVGGAPLLEPLGIELGRFKTLIRALQNTSIGVGGDSHVRLVEGRIAIGPDRLGPPLAFGGPALTPTDAFVVLGELVEGERARALAGVAALGGELGLEPEAAARAIIDQACACILESIEAMVTRINTKPVYTIHEMLDGYRIAPTRILVLGGPAQQFERHLATHSTLPVSLVPAWRVANAIGAAMARTTCEVCLLADTERGLVSISDTDHQWRCEHDYSRADALRQATDVLRELALDAGAQPDDLAVEVTEDSQFNTVRGFSTTGRNIRVTVQIKPGIIAGYQSTVSADAGRSQPC